MSSEQILTLHASGRMIKAMLAAIERPDDTRTVHAWAKAAGTSVTSLKAICAGAGVRPKDALDLARLIRAAIVHEMSSRPLIDLLDISDFRTVFRLLARACIDRSFPHDYSVERLLSEQRLITDAEILRLLRRELSDTSVRYSVHCSD